MARNRARGIRRHGAGWEVSVQVAGARRWTVFPLDTSLEAMQRWQRAERVKRPRLSRTAGQAHTLAGDAAAYLEAHQDMPTFSERERHLTLWVEALGPGRSRHTIEADEVAAQLRLWQRDGLPAVEGRRQKAPLSLTTIRHLRSVLQALYTFLDGKGARNPAAAVPLPKARYDEPRTLSTAATQALLGRIQGAKTKARLMVLATMGLPPAQIMALTPEGVTQALASGVLRVPGRKKGRGTTARDLPLSEPMRFALKALLEARATGPYSTSSVRTSFRRAAAWCRTQEPPIAVPLDARPYDLRHALGAAIYLQTHDLATVARLLDHSDLRTTQRYAQAAAAAIDADVVTKLPSVLPLPKAAGEGPVPRRGRVVTFQKQRSRDGR